MLVLILWENPKKTFELTLMQLTVEGPMEVTLVETLEFHNLSDRVSKNFRKCKNLLILCKRFHL